MYTVIRSYTHVPGMREQFIKQVQERLVPLLNHVPGFHAFTLMENRRQPRRLHQHLQHIH